MLGLPLALALTANARTDSNTDPVIQQALDILGQRVNPIKVVEPADYDSINLPKALQPSTAKAVGFRVWRGKRPDEPIYVNRQSNTYQNALNRQSPADALMLASTLAHEQTHETEHGDIGEGAAMRKQADFIQSRMPDLLKNEDDYRRIQHYLRQINARANKLLNRW